MSKLSERLERELTHYERFIVCDALERELDRLNREWADRPSAQRIIGALNNAKLKIEAGS